MVKTTRNTSSASKTRQNEASAKEQRGMNVTFTDDREERAEEKNAEERGGERKEPLSSFSLFLLLSSLSSPSFFSFFSFPPPHFSISLVPLPLYLFRKSRIIHSSLLLRRCRVSPHLTCRRCISCRFFLLLKGGSLRLLSALGKVLVSVLKTCP